MLAGASACSDDAPPAQVPAPGGCDPACAAEEVCDAGKCVLPGPLASCASGPFADDLPSSGVKYVDAAAAAPGDGSLAAPYPTIAAALAAASDGETIALAAGSYPEALTIDKSVTLRGLCADKVRLADSVHVNAGSRPVIATIRGCRLAPAGFDVDAPQGFGDCADGTRGLRVSAGVEREAIVSLVQSEVAGWCVGVNFNAPIASGSALCVSRSRIWGNNKGIEVFNAPLLGGGTAACDGIEEAIAIELSQLDQNEVAGLFTRVGARGVGARASRFARNGVIDTPAGAVLADSPGSGFGLYLGDTSSAHLLANRVEDNENVGLALINNERPDASVFVIRENLVSGNRGAGIALQKLQAHKPVEIRGNLIAATRALGAEDGDGLRVSVDGADSYDVTVEGNTIADNARHGAFLAGVGGTVDGNAVRANQKFGVLLQQDQAVSVGVNAFDGNLGGNVHRYQDPVEKYGALPLPLP